MKARFEMLRQWVMETAERLRWLPLLLTRLTVGVVFLQSGWGKLHSLEKVTDFFTSLKIPAPAFQAHLVATTEFVGGILMLAGLLSRVAAVPLTITMVVAILTAKTDDLKDWGDLFGFNEFAYLVFFVVVAVLGPGAVSLDALILRWLKPAAPGAPLGRLPSLASRAVGAVAVIGLGVLVVWAVAFKHGS